MERVYGKSEALLKVGNKYCPGCFHSMANKLVAQSIEELGLREKATGIIAVGCANLSQLYYNFDMIGASHGRAPAVATGFKRMAPDRFVFCYQGDGDLASIGLAETVHAANRGEHIAIIFINNSTYGMTGGQMAPTTLLGMKASTAPKGRIAEEHGYPMHMCEILNQLTAPCYLERTSCNTPQNVIKTKNAIKKAFKNQIEGKGFSMVEIVTSCPTNWGLDPLDALDFIEQKMLPEFPLGVIRDR